MYKCKQCGIVPLVTPEGVVKACKCDAPIIMMMSAELTDPRKDKNGVKEL